MISIHDCISFSGLSADQVDVVAMRMHVPTVVAAEWAEAILDQPGGQDLMDGFLAAEEAGFTDAAASRFAVDCLRLLRDARTRLN